MSFNPNFYNYRGNLTFQCNQIRPSFPLPPPPPPPVTPHMFTPELSDQDFVKKFENRIAVHNPSKVKAASISSLREEVTSLLKAFKEIQKQEKYLNEHVESLPDEEWRTKVRSIEINKSIISGVLAKFSGSYLDMSRKMLAKRSSKRLRLKRLRKERQQEKKEKEKELAERSRLIDENLQKIKDSIQKAKQEEETKLHADVVLKDVIRKKGEAKKCIGKLDALVKLRQARQNTAKGRGERVSEREANIFQGNIEKLKSMWALKLSQYEAEENELREKLQDSDDVDVNKDSKNILENLQQWRELLFGGKNPQIDFQGNIHSFVSVRGQWDHYLSSQGSPLPIGWVLPKNQQ